MPDSATAVQLSATKIAGKKPSVPSSMTKFSSQSTPPTAPSSASSSSSPAASGMNANQDLIQDEINESEERLRLDKKQEKAADEERKAAELKRNVLEAAKKAGHNVAEFGSGVATGAKGGATEAANGTIKLTKKSASVASSVVKDTFAVVTGTYLWLFAFAALFVHAYDFFNNFSLSSSHRGVMLILYIFLILWAVFFHYKTGFKKESLRYVGLGLLAWALPYLKVIPFLVQSDYFHVFLTLLPVWFLTIALTSEDVWLQRTGKLLIIFLVIAMIFLLLSMFLDRDMLPDVSDVGVSSFAAVKRFFASVGDAVSSIRVRLSEGNLFNPNAWKKRIDATFNPSAYYVGTVEQNKEEPHGVYITKLQSLYPTTFVGTPPALIGHIEAKTFVPGGVTITPSCRLERGGRGVALGYPDVATIPVGYQLARDVICTFDAATNLTPGTYYGVMGAEFPFETWSYVTFTFVSRNAILNYQMQGKDVNAELDISPTTPVVYTNGPVSLGISASRQPIDINLASETGDYIQQRFGFTLDNRWSQGELEEVSQVRILVPKPFVLQQGSCFPTDWTSGPVEAEDGMLEYTFTKDLSMDVHHDYRTVTCKLTLDRAGAEEVLAFGDKTPVTFAVIAEYTYKLEKKVPIKVGE